jgi:hypothetical protein
LLLTISMLFKITVELVGRSCGCFGWCPQQLIPTVFYTRMRFAYFQ